jgi:2,5-diketo-D-gluconate reductase A
MFVLDRAGKIKSMTTSANSTSVPYLDLNDGNRIPQLGFGVFQVPPDETAAAVANALRSGYRSIDTAAIYRNEAGVAEAIADSGIERGQLYITTKLWNDQQGADRVPAAFDHSLERLGLDYVDLYLIHWPVPSADRFVDTWKALIELKQSGRARSIGVSNFRPQDLERIVQSTGVVPSVNQIELHPRLQQRELRRMHQELGIATEAWSPLGQGQLIGDPAVAKVAAAHGRTPAQVILRWHLQLGVIAIPKSVTPSRIRENFDVFGFELSDEQMRVVATLDAHGRIGPDPDRMNWLG